MKKILWVFVSLFVLAACSKDEYVEPSNNVGNTDMAMHFYGIKRLEQPNKQGAAQHDRLWHNGTIIKVKFLNGSAEIKNKVIWYAQEWEKYANIHFKFIESGDAHVRIGFDWNDNRYITWSYIGTDCKAIADQNEATMSFAYLDYPEIPQSTIRADVLRAFGQVLGLELENRNINFTPIWSPLPNRVPNYWAFNITDVQWAELKKYVFDPLDADNAISTSQYDALSIMKWPFPSNVLLNGGAGTNEELSDTDKAFIWDLYPRDPVVTMTTAKQEINFYAGNNCIFRVDWGDGTYTFGDTEFSHTYTDSKEHTIKVALCIGSFSMFKCEGNDITDIKFGYAPDLWTISCYRNKISRLNLSSCPVVGYVDLGSAPICYDWSALYDLVESLPSRIGDGVAGIMNVGNPVPPTNIQSMFAEKNWMYIHEWR